MTNHADKSQNTQAQDAAASPSRRQLLRFGVAAAPLVLTVRAAHATQVVNSVSNCFVPVPQIVDGAGNPKYLPGQVRKNPSFNVKANGGPYNPPSPPPGGATNGYYGQQVLQMANNGGRPANQSAHLNYIARFSSPGKGQSCVTSINFDQSQRFGI